MINKICAECESPFKSNPDIGNINGSENLCPDCRKIYIKNKQDNEIFFNKQKEFYA